MNESTAIVGTFRIVLPSNIILSILQNSFWAFVVHSNLTLKFALLFAEDGMLKVLGTKDASSGNVFSEFPMTSSAALKLTPSADHDTLNISLDSQSDPNCLSYLIIML